ncbi:MAG: hypothetical protein M3P08_20240 [Thermoproteota archaeon]|nr:hypothetical protein [Thermoproteota archaeon]
MLKSEITTQTSLPTLELNKNIQSITKYQNPYIKKRLENMAKQSPHNIEIITNYMRVGHNSIDVFHVLFYRGLAT